MCSACMLGQSSSRGQQGETFGCNLRHGVPDQTQPNTTSSHDSLVCWQHASSSKDNIMLDVTYVAGKGSWGDNGSF